MRDASKVAGRGVFNGDVRGGLSSAPPTAQSLRTVSHPVADTISSGKVSGGDVAEVQTATISWEMVDDWECAGGVDDLLSESSEPIGRVVFGGISSLEEAKEATSESKDALDKVYLSLSNCSITERGDPFAVGQESSLPLLANSEYLETKSCISYDPKSASVSKPAIQAFKMFSQSPVAQSVIASIACDPELWNAVLKNEVLLDFIQSQKAKDVLQNQGSPKMLDETSDSKQWVDIDSQSADSGNLSMDFFQTAKHKAVEIVSNAADYLQNIFGFSSADKTCEEADGEANEIEKTLGASFMGLAIMVIVVVLLKRA